MNKKCCLFSVLILPLLSGCKDEVKTADFLIGAKENKIVELSLKELSSKVDTQHDTFFLATHKGDSCICWTNFQYVISRYNEARIKEGKDYLPFYSFDTELMTDNLPENFKVDRILSGYTDFYIFKDGEILDKYSKNAKKDAAMFEKEDKFGEIVDKHINNGPIKDYQYVSYEYACRDLINKDNNEFVLFTTRSGCGDCNYCMPNVVTPFLKENALKTPVYICDIEKYRGTDDYDTVKANLKLTVESNSLGYGAGVVPTYQYWKNGELLDAGVYANDSFFFDETANKVQVKDTYFDGTRELKFTTENLKNKMNSEAKLPVKEYSGKYFMDNEKAAVYHDPLIKSFLSYYCINK